MGQTDRMVSDQVEVFERGETVGHYVRKGVFRLHSDGYVDLECDASADASVGLRSIAERGVDAPDSSGGVVLPSAGREFLDGVIDYFSSMTYHRVRRTRFPVVPDGCPQWLRDAVFGSSDLVRSGRDLSAEAMEEDAGLAAAIESHTREIESLRDTLLSASIEIGCRS